MNILIVICALSIASYMLFSKRLSTSSNWQATVTPLASIMGSGFLVSAPLLSGIAGNYAVFAMALLLFIAYCIGSAIRFNIKYFEDIEQQKGTAQTIGFISRILLMCSYFISVSYYLQLLAAFLLNLIHIDNLLYAKILSTSILTLIALVGITKGLDKLEKVEKFTIAINFAMIGALILSLILYNFHLFQIGSWQLKELPFQLTSNHMRVLLGLLIVVQGFETSRYLGARHPKDQRIKTMRSAQIISSGIYLAFLFFVTILFKKDMGTNITAIISMTLPVASLLPILLSITAIGSQFSAAVADSEGAGGLIQDLSKKKIGLNFSYVIILAATVLLTWLTQVTEIIAYASRAFAIYYMMQCLIAFFTVNQASNIKNPLLKKLFFLTISVVCLLIFVYGLPAE